MNKFSYLLGIALLAMTHAQWVQADVIADTGVPQGSGYASLSLDSGDWLAAQFATTQEWKIGGIEGYITDNGDDTQIGNSFTISVYKNNADNLPTLAGKEFSRSVKFTGNGWNGLTGLNLDLSAGSYWVAFEIGAGNTLQGSMPVSTANPLTTAWYDGISTGGYQATTGVGNDFGVFITSVPATPNTAVPLPPGLLLFISGLLSIGCSGKRQSF